MDKRASIPPVPHRHDKPATGGSPGTQTQCPYCFSTKVQIVDSYEMRDVMVIHCLNCGRQSEVDTEHDETSAGTIVPAPIPEAP